MIYLRLFLNFLKIGLFTIGGGYAMIPLISETCLDYGWLTEEQLINFIAISESTPGPFAVNIATFVGNTTGGILGALCAVFGLFLPSFVIIFVIYKLAKRFFEKQPVQDAFTALKPTVVALIASAFVTVTYATLFIADGSGATSFNWFGLVWGAICFLAMRFIKKLHPIILIIISAGVGILFYGFIL